MNLHFCWARCQQTGRFWWSATGGPAPDVASPLSGLKLQCSLHGSQLQRPSSGPGSDSPVRCKAAERDSVHGKRGKKRAALTKSQFNRPVLWTVWASSCLWSSRRWCLALTGWSFCCASVPKQTWHFITSCKHKGLTVWSVLFKWSSWWLGSS